MFKPESSLLNEAHNNMDVRDQSIELLPFGSGWEARDWLVHWPKQVYRSA